MGNPIRMFRIIEMLRNARRGLTAAALADRLEVSRRTVYRDIAALQAMSLPIDGAAGIGYILRPGFDLPRLNFSAEEVEAITVALALLPRTGDTGLLRAAESVASKLATANGTQPALAASGWHGIPAGANPAPLRRAIRESRVLALRYRDGDGAITEREVLPLALTYFVEVQVFAAYCRLRQAIRHFRLDRVEALAPTGERFAAEAPALRRLLAAPGDTQEALDPASRSR